MRETGNNGRREPYAGGMDRDLDRMLDMLAPPAPSDTLRARLKRDFDAAGAASSATAASGHKWPSLRGQWGGVAVAASLVLAVVLGIVAPPVSNMPDDRRAAGATAYETAASDEGLTDAELLAASAPDDPLYMIVTYNAGVAAYSDTSRVSESAPRAVSAASYTGTVAGEATDDGDVFATMPLE